MEEWLLGQYRQRIETTGSQLVDLLHIEDLGAKTDYGLAKHVIGAMTAFTLGIYLNFLLGHELLAVKALFASFSVIGMRYRHDLGCAPASGGHRSAVEGTSQDLATVADSNTILGYVDRQLTADVLAGLERQINAALVAQVPAQVWQQARDIACDLYDGPSMADTELLAYACAVKRTQGRPTSIEWPRPTSLPTVSVSRWPYSSSSRKHRCRTAGQSAAPPGPAGLGCAPAVSR